MSKVYMVKSSLVFLTCHINITLLTFLLIFSLSKSSSESSMLLDWLMVLLYVSGVFFNIYVILDADRKWDVIVMYLKYYASHWRIIHKEARSRLLSFLEASPRFLCTLRQSLMQPSESVQSNEFPVFRSPKPLKTDQSRPKSSEVVSNDAERLETQAVSRSMEKEEIQAVSKCVESISKEDKTPELNCANLLRPVCRPKSDPVKRIVKNKCVKAQSPELFKNKIYKSRMNLTTGAFPKMDLMDK